LLENNDLKWGIIFLGDELMKNFEKDSNFIFTFCKACWDFKKIVFDQPINFENDKPQFGKCENCGNSQSVNLKDAKAYYENLNEDNN
jgi:ribosomal protein S27E